MNRKKFFAIAGGTIVAASGIGYLLSDKSNFGRDDINLKTAQKSILKADEKEILYLASLAPSGHNTQPWFVKYIAPYHWTICNDKSKWLHGVDPTQRETILSIGAFMQNLEFAANNAGYEVQFEGLAKTNQDENVVEVKLVKSSKIQFFDITKIKNRRTVRSNFLGDALKKEDENFLFRGEKDHFNFMAKDSKEFKYLNEQTIEANRIQSYRDEAEKELADWIRFSNKDAEKYRDGLTTASMEIEGISGWVVRNFYDKSNVMKNSFRDKNIEIVVKQVSQSAGWLLITSQNNSVSDLLETGKRMQRLFLKVREKGIAIHPMTQILEESATQVTVNQLVGIKDNIQFILRMGYLKNYPQPVTLRREVDSFVRV